MTQIGLLAARCALAAVVAGAVARAQTTPPANVVSIHGRVVADDTGEPLRNARIACVPGKDTEPVRTDTEGWFVVVGVGPCAVSAAKTGFATKQMPLVEGVEIASRAAR